MHPMHPSDEVCAEKIVIDSRQARLDLEIKGDYYLLYLPQTRGQVELSANGHTIHQGFLFPGMMRIAAPGEKSRVALFSPMKYTTLRLPGRFFRSAWKSLDGSHRPGKFSFIDPLIEPNPDIARLGRLVSEPNKFVSAERQLFFQGVSKVLLAYLARNHGWSLLKPAARTRLSDDELHRSTAFVDANLHHRLTLTGWASHLRLTADDFRRRFKTTTGVSPYAWILQRRLERAKQLLASSQESLAQIALAVGFCSQSHFTDAFSRSENATPARWRAAHAARK
jgi:AraC family transcriptional regulator